MPFLKNIKIEESFNATEEHAFTTYIHTKNALFHILVASHGEEQQKCKEKERSIHLFYDHMILQSECELSTPL